MAVIVDKFPDNGVYIARVDRKFHMNSRTSSTVEIIFNENDSHLKLSLMVIVKIKKRLKRYIHKAVGSLTISIPMKLAERGKFDVFWFVTFLDKRD